jgi:hypothetical protein
VWSSLLIPNSLQIRGQSLYNGFALLTTVTLVPGFDTFNVEKGKLDCVNHCFGAVERDGGDAVVGAEGRDGRGTVVGTEICDGGAVVEVEDRRGGRRCSIGVRGCWLSVRHVNWRVHC